MRANHSGISDTSDVVEIEFDERIVPARRGESLLASLMAAEEYHLRTTQSGAPRGPFCGMGVCQECLVEIDGKPSQRACLVRVDASMTIRRQAHKVITGTPQRHAVSKRVTRACETVSPQVAVAGGGPAGMAAAISAARLGADVVLLDERAKLGGQYFKQPLSAPDIGLAHFDDRQFAAGRKLAAEAVDAGVRILSDTQIVGAYEPLELVIRGPGGVQHLHPARLIVATGAYERPLPVPGWTLPGVMTTGAAQTLLRSYRVLAGRRILVAGNGPLNLQVALELSRAGAEVVAVAEAASPPNIRNAPAIFKMLATSPGLAMNGLNYLLQLRRRGVPVKYGQRLAGVASAKDGAGHRLVATLVGSSPQARRSADAGRTFYEIDAVCIGYGFLPSNELLRALGCVQSWSPLQDSLTTVRDENFRTSRANVFAIGDCAQMAGAMVARAEGEIAGTLAARSLGFQSSKEADRLVRRARSRRERHLGFQGALWTLFKPPPWDAAQIDDQVLACRCEERTMGELRTAIGTPGSAGFGSIKRATRTGMGRCQGRYCGITLAGAAAQFLGRTLDEADLWAPRPPVKPVTIADLAALTLADDKGGS